MITSLQNPKIKLVRSLIAQKSARQEAGAFVIEGVRLAEEAHQAGWHPNLVLHTRLLSKRGLELVQDFASLNCEVEEISPELMNRIADTETPQGIIAVLPTRQLAFPAELDFVVVADGLRDPGNLGALLRAAAAAGVQAFFLTPGSADPLSPKALRAGMGAQFHLPITILPWKDIYAQLKSQPRPLQFFLAEANAGTPCWNLDLRVPLALVIGGEADGAAPEAHRYIDASLHIPMPGYAESLNAAVAAAILIFEVIRQRSQ